MSVLRLCWRGFIRLTKRQTEGGRKGRKERKGVPARPSLLIMAEVWERLGGRTTVWVQRDARKLRGMTEAEMKTWPALCSNTKVPFNLTNSLVFFFFAFFLVFLSSSLFGPSRDSSTLFLFFLLKQFFLLKSLTWLQPGGLFFFFFHESGTTCVFKTCRGWNNWLRGDVFFFFSFFKIRFCNWLFFFFSFKEKCSEGEWQKIVPLWFSALCLIVTVQPCFRSVVKAFSTAVLDTENRRRGTDSRHNN